MKFLYLFISTLLCSALAQEFTLPKLNINTNDVTCDNAQDLLAAAQSDLTRLKTFVEQDIPAAQNYAKCGTCRATRACNVAVSGPLSSLLQMQKSSKRKNKCSKVPQDCEKFVDQERSHLYNQLIADKLDKTTVMMLQIGSSSGEPIDTYNLCNVTLTNLETLSKYLDWVAKEITTKYINGDLPQRIQSINDAITKCASLPITFTGLIHRNYYDSNLPLKFASPNGKFEDYKVDFPQAFDVIPSVGVAFLGCDFNQQTPRFQDEVTNITLTGFTLRIIAPPNVGINLIQFQYIATISSRSGIYITTNSINKANDTDLQAVSAGGNPRTVTRSITPPAGLKNVQSFAFIRQYDFTPGQNTRLSVATSGDSKSLTYQFYQESIVNSVSATVLFWNGDDKSITPTIAEIPKSGRFTQGSGSRNFGVQLDISKYSNAPEAFFGLFQYEVYEGSGYRVKEWYSTDQSTATINFQTWYYTKVDWLRSNVLFSCRTSDKSKCLKQ